MQDLINFLHGRFIKKFFDVCDVPEAEERAVEEFVEFARDFLSENRPSALTHAEANYIVKLTNGDEVFISPPMESAKGGMQQTGRAIPVTGQDTAREIIKHGGP